MSIDPSKLFLRRGEDTERGRSKNQEKKVSRQIGGRVTIGSGNTDKDKGDAFAKDCRVRVEAKRKPRKRGYRVVQKAIGSV